MKKNHIYSPGFTMIELLVVATIIIVLTTIGLVSYQSAGVRARNGKRQADMETVRQALVLYRTDAGVYPDPATNGDSAAFVSALGDISEYISNEVADPINDATYNYTYSTTGGVDFQICVNLEPDVVQLCQTNP
ncbi:MAG: type II secretion system GspH family protein [bacterium]|nr:type II secretion system GspH family protein [bacterium]